MRGRGYYREKLDADHSYSLIVIITVMMLIIMITIIALIYYCVRRLNEYRLNKPIEKKEDKMQCQRSVIFCSGERVQTGTK